MSADLVLVDGEPAEEPDLSADRLLGLTCFETIAFTGEGLVHGEDHLERLADSARTLALTPVGGWEAVDEAIEQALARTEHEEGILRVSLHAIGEPVGLHMAERGAEVQIATSAPRYGELAEGVTCVTSSIPAPGEGWPAHVKAPCLPRILAHREARGRGAFEALMLDGSDHVVSGTRSNVHARVDDELVTPPSPPAFPGVTRARVRQAADELAIPLSVRELAREELREARELVLTFTGPGVVPVVELDGRAVADGKPGDWTRKLRDALER